MSDEVILRYLKKHQEPGKKGIWKIMSKDGFEISYDRFLRRLKKLESK